MENDLAIKFIKFITDFTSIVYEAMPFIVLGAVIAGILEELVPQRFITRIIPRSRLLSILIGGLLGLVFPMCECGIIPIMRRLIRKGVPVSTCTAYLLAGPIINVVVMMSTAVAFSGQETLTDNTGRLTYQMGSWWMMGLRMGLGYLVAVGTSVVVEWQYRRHGNKLLMPAAMPPAELKGNGDEEEVAAKTRTLSERLGTISQTALHDFVDIMVFLILGALIAAFARQAIPRGEVENFATGYPLVAIGMMMGLAVLLCLCSEADAFVAASYVSLRPSAKLAFLVLGPMLDLKLYTMYTRVFRPRLIWTIFGSVIVQVFIYSIITHYLWERFAPEYVFPKPTPVSTDTGH